jgi:hypothetical protein
MEHMRRVFFVGNDYRGNQNLGIQRPRVSGEKKVNVKARDNTWPRIEVLRTSVQERTKVVLEVIASTTQGSPFISSASVFVKAWPPYEEGVSHYWRRGMALARFSIKPEQGGFTSVSPI